MSHDTAIERAGDEMIVRGVETTLGTYYRLGSKITVRGSGTGNHWLCLTCQGLDRWADKDRKGCAHIERVRRWAADHPEQEAAA